MPTILTSRSIRDAEEVSRLLQDALSLVLQRPPIRDRRASAVATELGVGRMTCQRIMKLRKIPEDASTPGAELLTELPGTGGLRDFLEALAGTGTPRETLADAFAAVDAFETYLREIGLSQTGFASALSLYRDTSDPVRLRDRRMKLFDANPGEILALL